MAFKLPALPFSTSELQPHMSKKTIEFHYGKHHKKYLETLNKLIRGTELDELTLEEVILESYHREEQEIFNNAAQTWNHSFFWHCLSGKNPHPSKKVLDLIKLEFSSLQDFKFKFSEAATKLFGSGWVWLVKNEDGKLSIEATKDAENPLTQGQTPILVLDVWEHAYYLDYQNERAKFVKNFWQIVNWSFVEKNLSAATVSKKYLSTPARRRERVVDPIHLN